MYIKVARRRTLRRDMARRVGRGARDLWVCQRLLGKYNRVDIVMAVNGESLEDFGMVVGDL